MDASPEPSTPEVTPRPVPAALESTPPARHEPPGLEALRRFFRKPWIQGIWAWLCLIGRGIRAAWEWLDENAGPIARGMEKAGNIAVRGSRGAVAVGRGAREIGGKVQEWGRERGNAGLRRIGKRMGHFGNRLTRGGAQAEEIAEGVEDLGETLTEIVGAEDEPKPSASPPAATRRPALEARPQPRRPAPPTARPAVFPEPDSEGDLPERIRERIRALGKRKRSAPLRRLIVDICTHREWTTVGELSEWFGMDTSNLQRRHLRPMLKSGELRLRYPDNPRHPEQGYRAVGR